MENKVTPERQAALVDLLSEHHDATRDVSDDTREEGAGGRRGGTGRRLDPRNLPVRCRGPVEPDVGIPRCTVARRR
ncbi:MAG: hypothetical protein ACRDRH_21470 [Pseudonocardia sp.]